SGENLQQTGSGPNFQGGCLTLCTCKGQMRSGLRPPPTNWKGVWVAGFASRKNCETNWLFYLTQVEFAYPSQKDLWERLPSDMKLPDVWAKKSSRHNRLGDLYEPKYPRTNSFEPNCHYPPKVGHVHHKTESDDHWRHNIEAEYYNRHPALLAGDTASTSPWPTTIIRFEYKL